DLTDFFIEQRGKEQDPHFYDQEQAKRDGGFHYNDHGPSWMIKDKTYSQAHKHLSEQKEAIGHAVRFVYLLAGVAHLARLSKDQEKFNWCKDLWRNVIDKQMYITGAIGSQ
ncbi:glycoside hydrolase family 127 protein, partial [Escherichia coli]|nr:glycoside hydrolase family 127 protein [Escherichia coli]